MIHCQVVSSILWYNFLTRNSAFKTSVLCYKIYHDNFWEVGDLPRQHPAKRHKIPAHKAHRGPLKVHILPKAREKNSRKAFLVKTKGETKVPVTLHIGKDQNSTNLHCRTEGFNIQHVYLDCWRKKCLIQNPCLF